MAYVLVEGFGSVSGMGNMNAVEGQRLLVLMDRFLGEHRTSCLITDMLQYRADPKFWDSFLKAVEGEDWLSEKQAQADQMMAALKEAWPDEH